eukprot:m51a1_g864 putative protein serine threonine kinase (549) ;mRNA; f:811292-813592
MWKKKIKNRGGSSGGESATSSPVVSPLPAVPPLPPLPAQPQSLSPVPCSSPTVGLAVSPGRRSQSPPAAAPAPAAAHQSSESPLLPLRRFADYSPALGEGETPRSARDLPAEINGWKPVELIGSGATGVVYKAVNVSTGEFAAIKLMKKNSKLATSSIQSIQKEIEILNKLNHPNIVKVISHSASDDHISLVLEYVDGGSLLSIVQKFGRFPENLAAIYMDHVMAGLIYLHQNGVIHRDIKGANILITKEGVAKLVDFGCAAAVCADMTKRVTVVGTPYWMAPEVVEMSGQCAESDIWSVGATIIELLTTVPPYWGAPPVSAMFHIVQDPHPPLPDKISPELNDLLTRCFNKDPSRRPSAELMRNHPWFLKHLRVSERPSCATPSIMPVMDIVEAVKTFNGDSTFTGSDTPDWSSEDDLMSPVLALRRSAPVSAAGTDAIHKIAELNKLVESLQAKVEKQKKKQMAYKECIQALQTKCTQQQQALISRNTDSKTLQDFFYLVAMASRINRNGKQGTETNVKALYEKAQKESVPWNQWIEWVPKAMSGQ